MTAAGLYVHVPFCLTRCGYCDFNAYAGLDHLQSRYVRAVLAEATLAAPAWASEGFDTVFLGGGTPTTLADGELRTLLDGLRARLDVAKDAEITVEANPDTVDPAGLTSLREAGVTRLSMGAQSFDPAVLASLERIHQPEAVRRAFAAARSAGFDDINLDLIYGAESESRESWRTTLDETIALEPEHVSAYALTVEPATPLGRKVATGATPAPDPDAQADGYALACERLAGAGYRHYEVSNWAKPERECRHNLAYWRRNAYVGLGAGAHSFRGRRRWWNVRPPEQYLAIVEAGDLPEGGNEELTPEEEHTERMLLGLRTREGVAAADVDSAEAARLVETGLLEHGPGAYLATEEGMLLANELALALSTLPATVP